MTTGGAGHVGVHIAAHVLQLVDRTRAEGADLIVDEHRLRRRVRCTGGDDLTGTRGQSELRRVDPLTGARCAARVELGVIGVVGDRHGDGRLSRMVHGQGARVCRADSGGCQCAGDSESCDDGRGADCEGLAVTRRGLPGACGVAGLGACGGGVGLRGGVVGVHGVSPCDGAASFGGVVAVSDTNDFAAQKPFATSADGLISRMISASPDRWMWASAQGSVEDAAARHAQAVHQFAEFVGRNCCHSSTRRDSMSIDDVEASETHVSRSRLCDLRFCVDSWSVTANA